MDLPQFSDTPGDVAAVVAGARALLGDRLSVNATVRAQHGRGEDTTEPRPPDAVAFPATTAEVSALAALCHRHRVPLVPFGAGTSLEGHVTPVRGGLTLDLSRMDAVVEVNEGDLDCVVEPGVTRQALNAHLRDRGLFFPVDPGSVCTIGGMCATRASGTNAVRYGTIRENVLGLEVVLADGRVIPTGGRTRKAANGYDLTHLMIGSEGTLGVITKVRLRLHGIPEAVAGATCAFASLEGAVETVIATMQSGVPVARIELLNATAMAASIAHSRLEGMAAAPTLFLEFHGSPAAVAEQAATVQAIAAELGGGAFAGATEAGARTRLWQARHDIYWAALALRPGARGLTTDVCVPISRLAEAILGAEAAIAESGFVAPLVGHVGDGNFHTLILVDPDDAAELERAWALDRRIVEIGLDLGGTCSGEHGVGLGKREFLEREHGAEALSVMRAVKQALDPRDILNPGKILRG